IDPNDRNIGDLLNAKGVSWGWFQGGFSNCAQTHANKAGIVSKDYIPHHEPFQYYASTANPLHLPPLSPQSVGHQDQANHQYDLALSPIVNQSQDPVVDALAGTTCGQRPEKVMGGYQDRCGYGPRLPLLVVSPYAKSNFVDHTTTDQTSILRFVEDNWSTGSI